MYHYDRMQKTKELGDKVADEIIKKISNLLFPANITVSSHGEDLQEKIDLTLKLAQLMKVMDDLEGASRN
mgnify:CR=1 FL=1